MVAQQRVDAAARLARLAQRVRETGIAYDIFADPNTAAQRWALDLLPVVISAHEWQGLERALIQRARLLGAAVNKLAVLDRLLTELAERPEKAIFYCGDGRTTDSISNATAGVRPAPATAAPPPHVRFSRLLI